MSAGLGGEGGEPIGDLISAINSREPERLRRLLAPDVEVRTARTVHRGIDAAVAWAQRTYEHLDRRFLLDELIETDHGLLGLGRVQYVWREEGRVGDESPIWLGFELHEGLVRRIAMQDDEASALAALGEPPG